MQRGLSPEEQVAERSLALVNALTHPEEQQWGAEPGPATRRRLETQSYAATVRAEAAQAADVSKGRKGGKATGRGTATASSSTGGSSSSKGPETGAMPPLLAGVLRTSPRALQRRHLFICFWSC